jgi:hypothetical protein
MKASELRIGNLVEYKNQYINVSGIGPFGIQSEGKKYLIIAKFSTPDIQPILLTEEWLLKFGFEINRQTKEENNIWRCYSEEGFFEVEQIGSSFFLDDNHCYGTKINYVHQLQNLYFALTGEELVVKE